MALSIKDAGVASPNGRHFVVSQRIYKTQDGRIVGEGDPDANSLVQQAGERIAMSEAIALGLVEEEVPVEEKPAQTKKAAKPKDKKAPAAKNKSKGK